MSKSVIKESSVLDPIRKEMDRQKAEKAKMEIKYLSFICLEVFVCN